MNRIPALVTDRLVLWAPLAAALGLLFAGTAARANGLIPVLLAVMVFASGFTTPPARLLSAFKRPERVLGVLALQYGPLSLLAYALSRLPLSPATATGLLVLGAAPSEITSGVMVLLAGGDAALGAALMGTSLLASATVTPWLLLHYAGGQIYVDQAGLLQELMVTVAGPLIVASTLRGFLAERGARARMTASTALWETPSFRTDATLRADARLALPAWFWRDPAALLAVADRLLPAVAALAVIALLFIVAGTARHVVLSGEIAVVAGLCLLLNLAGYAAGWGLFRLLRAPELAVRAGVFTVGMREFGVAATVAMAVLPDAAAVAGVYGIVILVTAPLLVQIYNRRDRTLLSRPSSA